MEKRSIALICLGISLAMGLALLIARGIFGISLAKIGSVFQDGSVLITPRTETGVPAGSGEAEGSLAKAAEAKAASAKATAAKPALCAKTAAIPSRDAVIINEVAWMGSPASYSNEWIELKNISSQSVDLNGWQLQNAKQKIKIFFGTGVIEPGGLYLLERTDDESVPLVAADLFYAGSLANSNDGLDLYDGRCVLRDQVSAASKWLAGDNLSKRTMERTVNFFWISSKEPGGTPKAENNVPLNGNVPAL